MKRLAFALTLILALLFSAAVGTLFISLAKANPFPTYPVISIESPTNKTYTVNSLFLNVTLVTQWDGLYFTSNRRLVSYCIDGKETIPIAKTEYRFDSEKQASIWAGSAVLADLAEGTHNLRVNAEYHYDNDKQIFVSVSNVSFTIDPTYSPSLSPPPSTSPTPTATPSPTTTPSPEPTSTPEQEPFPTALATIAFGVSVATIGAGLAVYFRKYNSKGLARMKRTALTMTLIVGLFLAITGSHLVTLTAANFIWFYDLPTQPDTNPPSVTVHSPTQNQTFDSQNITISFTVTKPETWIRSSAGKFVNGSEIYYVLGNITSFHYEVNGVESQSIPVQDISTVYLANPQRTLRFSINLTLPEGQHTLYVGVEGETIYRQGGVMDPLASNIVHGASETINFSIAEKPEPESFPTAFVAAASGVSVAFVGVGLLVYLKKRGKGRNS